MEIKHHYPLTSDMILALTNNRSFWHGSAEGQIFHKDLQLPDTMLPQMSLDTSRAPDIRCGQVGDESDENPDL